MWKKHAQLCVLLLHFGNLTNCLHQQQSITNKINQQQHAEIHQEQLFDPPVYLENLEDLEHVAYMSMRNFNLTGDSLLQSSWLMNSLGGNPLQHKQHQPDPAASLNLRARQALQLESFISHLRNGHLRRLRINELASIYDTLVGGSYSAFYNDEEKRQVSNNINTTSPITDESQVPDRCQYLVGIYQLELKERQAASLVAASASGSQQQHLESRIEFEGDQLNNQVEPVISTDRLRALCQMAIKCHSADELVQLISGPWQSQVTNRLESSQTKVRRADMGSATTRTGGQPQSLRDSLSLSIAKLCPIILFQLHDDEGLCSIRRDDRPPMLTVWGFATLFVTIVSFCSLIGLSITPLIGPVPSDSSGSDSTPPINGSHSPVRLTGANGDRSTQHQHRACLTLFEGLAVGSLVGSALFSLIPQAFELQERESNQGFLLKALIIFFGIYLFFCSERLMRIILDTRQLRKKRKRLLNHRSSNSIQLHSPMNADYFYQPPLPIRNQVSSRLVKSALKQRQQAEMYQNIETGQGVAGQDGSGPPAGVNFPLTDQSTCKADSQSTVRQQQQLTVAKRQTRKKLLTASKRRKRRRNGTASPVGSDLDAFSTKVRSNSTSSAHSSISNASLPGISPPNLDKAKDNRAVDKLPLQVDLYNYCQSSAENDADEQSASTLYQNQAEAEPESNADKWYLSDDQAPELDVKELKPRTSFRLADEDLTRLEADDNINFRNEYDYFMINRERIVNEPQETKRDISTVAWMIVLGDGLHNFIDGISIGAAFSESILSGVSISVAVICEEFPHELGDFAVLVSSGMTVRQALGYNFLSACTCYFGMALGIILGDVNDGASYISALAAGVFLYIALVDMMGELSAALEETSRNSIAKTLKLLLLQNVGIFIGISIIFILSFIDF